MSLNFNVFDQAVLTQVVERSLETPAEGISEIGEQLAPSVPVQSREVSVQVRDVNAFGVGQFRAPGATPPLFEPSAELREEVIELALLDEMHRIKDEDYLNLQSPDDNVKRKAGLSIVDRGRILGIRNRRLTEKLRWDAFSGSATIPYPDGSSIVVDYGFPANNTPTAGTLWSDTANADVIADLKAWQKLTANSVGHYGLRIHMSSDVWEDYVLENDALAAYLTGEDRPLLVPKKSDVVALLRDGTEIVITDAGYRDENQGTDRGLDAVTPYLPKDKVLITTNYTIEGERIADMPNGQVIVSSGYNQVAVRQGAQSEVILDHISKTHFLRYASARIPRIHHPGAFVYATVA